MNLVIADPLTCNAHADSAAQERKLVVTHPLTAKAARFEPGSETLIVGALSGNKDRGGWRAGPDEAAAGHLIPFDTTQITSRENRSNPQAGDPCHPLAAEAHPPAIAYQGHGSNVGPMGALRQGNGNVTGGVPFIVDGQNAAAVEMVGAIGTGAAHGNRGFMVTHTLSAEGADASEDGTGRGTPQGVTPRESLPALGTTKEVGLFRDGAVRRLTPLEYERLQGFPDGWTCLCGATEAILMERGITDEVWRASDWRTIRLDEHVWRCACPDGPRYRAMGNAVTVTAVQWIARRLKIAIAQAVKRAIA